jgi:pSer/pThr/pTyr-binding forkhead associated (FHA) protein
MPEIHLRPLRPDGADGCVGCVVADLFPYTIGRSHSCDLRLSDPSVSRRHCRLVVRGGRVWVHDLESANGTFVNGERVRETRPLNDGDALHLGVVPFRVQVPDAQGDRMAVPAPSADSRRSDAGGSWWSRTTRTRRKRWRSL